MLSTIDRYLIKETLYLFLLILICFFSLFALIDFTSRSSSLHLNGIELASYYFHLFVRRVEVLAPFSLLVAVIRTICVANSRHELAAMMASGRSLRRTLYPLVILGLACTLLLYLNNEFLLPNSLRTIHRIEDAHADHVRQKKQASSVHRLTLSDGSQILYRIYDSSRECFVDSFWVRSLDDLYRIKYLYPATVPPTGEYVEHFLRSDQNALNLVNYESRCHLSLMTFDDKNLHEATILPTDRSLQELWRSLPTANQVLNNEQFQAQATFYRRLVMPWLAFLACAGPIPYCARFRRPVPVFLLYCTSLVALMMAYLYLNAGSLLVQNQILSPSTALLFPSLFVALLVIGKWLKA